jgi:hypothetical protein
MCNCVYCGLPAGFLRTQLKECRERHDNATTHIPEFFKEALKSSTAPSRFHELTEELAKTSYIREPEYHQLVAGGFAEIVETATADKIVSEIEENRIEAF